MALGTKMALIFISLGKLFALFREYAVLRSAEARKALLFADQSLPQYLRGHTTSVERARSLSDSSQK